MINEQKLDPKEVDSVSCIEIFTNTRSEDTFRDHGFVISEDDGPIFYDNKEVGFTNSLGLNLYSDFVLDNLNLINRLIYLTKTGFYYANIRKPKRFVSESIEDILRS